MSNEKVGIMVRAIMGMSLSSFAKGLNSTPGMICNYETGRSKSARLDAEYKKLRRVVVDGCQEIIDLLTDDWGEVKDV